ncbi:MAG: hypothetical protein JZU63_13195, partial [Rhodoferax sp.]|nr:hypothetical protein [Rhodoferax sp.]
MRALIVMVLVALRVRLPPDLKVDTTLVTLPSSLLFFSLAVRRPTLTSAFASVSALAPAPMLPVPALAS